MNIEWHFVHHKSLFTSKVLLFSYVYVFSGQMLYRVAVVKGRNSALIQIPTPPQQASDLNFKQLIFLVFTEDNNSAFLMWLLLELNELTYEKHSEQCVAQNKWYKIISIITIPGKADILSSSFYMYFKICKYNV